VRDSHRIYPTGKLESIVLLDQSLTKSLIQLDESCYTDSGGNAGFTSAVADISSMAFIGTLGQMVLGYQPDLADEAGAHHSFSG
jgi:hypothetical protein